MNPSRPSSSAVFSRRAGFTLVELLVSMSVLMLILLVTFATTDSVSTVFKRTRAKIDTFQEARAGFEAMTRRVSQAMLNTYWDYEYPNGANGKPDTSQSPTSYARQSELHMVSGPTKEGSAPLLPAAEIQSLTHGVFFQSPQGFSAPPASATAAASTASLANLLNVSGYFVEYTSDKEDRPKFLRTGSGVPAERWRLRLMELNQPTENFRTYKATMAASKIKPFDWFREPLVATGEPAAKRVLAENVVALIIWPHRSPHDPPPSGAPRQLAPEYSYDSRLYTTKPSDALAKLTRNQLPPMLQVTMVAIDETSASRLQDRQEEPKVLPDSELELKTLFAKPSTSNNPTADTEGDQYRTDLKALEQKLVDRKLTYRVFSTDVSILQAKWSED